MAFLTIINFVDQIILFLNVANLIVIGYGCGIGWLSMALPLLQSDDSPLESGKISISDKSWMGSALSLAGVLGNFFFGFVVTWIGARNTIIVIGLPQLVSKLKPNFALRVDCSLSLSK